MTSRARQVRNALSVPSRTSTRQCRSPLAAAAEHAPDAGDVSTLATLVGHELRNARDHRAAAKRRNDHANWCRTHGRGELVTLVRTALVADGGATLRAIARATDGPMREACEAAAINFCRAYAEHGISSTTAAVMLLRACMLGAIADATAARVMAGEQGADPRVAAQLSTAARIDTLTALQVERSAREARASQPQDITERLRAQLALQQAEQAAQDRAGEADDGADGSEQGGDA